MNLESSAKSDPGQLIGLRDGLTDEENLRLRRAEDDLRNAQAAYDALAPLRQKRAFANKFRRCPRRQLTEDELRVRRAANQKACDERRLRLQMEADKHAFIHSLGEASSVTESSESLIAIFRTTGSLDRFAKQMKLTRLGAIHSLRLAGFDVIEDIAKEWDSGSALRKLSAKHGPIPQTISKWIKSTGRQIKPRNSNQRYDLDRMNELFQKKWSTNKIAEELKVSWATVQNASDARR